MTDKTSEPNQFACDSTTIGTTMGTVKKGKQGTMIHSLLQDNKNQSITIAELLKKV